MNKKIASLAVAAVMLAQSTVFAGSLNDFVNSSFTGENALETVDGTSVFSYKKFFRNDVKPAIIARVGNGGNYSEHHDGNPYVSSGNTFLYQTELDMSEVKTAFNTLYDITNVSIDNKNSTDTAKAEALKTKFKDSDVTGEFVVTVTYDTELSFDKANLEFKQNGAAPAIFAVTNTDDSVAGTVKVTFKVNDGVTVQNIKDNAALLDNLIMELPGVTTDTKDTDLKVSSKLTGRTTIKEDGTDAYGIIDFVSDDAKNSAVIKSVKSSSGGGGSTPITSGDKNKLKAYTVVDGNTAQITVKTENGVSTIDVDAIEKPVKEGSEFAGWYLDKELTKPASGTITITEDTYLYAKFTAPEEPEVIVVIDGKENKQELTDKDGKKVLNVDEIPVPEKEGFVFEGWYKTPFLTEGVSGEIEVDGKLNLYPRYVNITAPDALISEEHNAYISGYPDGEVKPEGKITREEVVAAFYRLLKPEYRATIESDEIKFADVASDRWSAKAIATLANGGYVVGDTEGNFNPAKPITRAEFAAIASKFIKSDAQPAANYFSDVAGHWAEDAILKVLGQYWINGYDDGTFKPDNNITRAEAMTIINKMLVRYGDEDSEHAKNWPDLSKDAWYYGAVIEATTDNEFTREDNKWSEKWLNEAE